MVSPLVFKPPATSTTQLTRGRRGVEGADAVGKGGGRLERGPHQQRAGGAGVAALGRHEAHGVLDAAAGGRGVVGEGGGCVLLAQISFQQLCRSFSGKLGVAGGLELGQQRLGVGLGEGDGVGDEAQAGRTVAGLWGTAPRQGAGRGGGGQVQQQGILSSAGNVIIA